MRAQNDVWGSPGIVLCRIASQKNKFTQNNPVKRTDSCVIPRDMNDSNPLALTSTQVLSLLNLSRSTLQKLVKRGQLTPLTHIKKSHRLFAVSEIQALLSPKK
jgi:hypothetical protein